MFTRIRNWLEIQYLNSPLALALHSRPWSWVYWLLIWSALLALYTLIVVWLCGH